MHARPRTHQTSVKHVYLDQNQWSYLSLALRGEPRAPEDTAAAEAVKRSVADGAASFPLSIAHVFETWKQRSTEKRQPLAQTMMEISRNDAIAPPQKLVPAELEHALHRRFGRPDPPADVEPFGRGLAHLSGGLASDPDPELSTPPARAASRARSRRRSSTASTRLLLAGPGRRTCRPPRSACLPLQDLGGGVCRRSRPSCRSGSSGRAPARTRSAGPWRPACWWTSRSRWRLRSGEPDVTLDEFTGPRARGAHSSSMFDLPSRVALVELMWRQHGDLQTKWKGNDLNDLASMSAPRSATATSS